MKRDPKSILVLRQTGALQPMSHALCVTVLASAAHLGASGNWIPSGVRPFNA
jgi:hypothetical protein